MQATDSGGEVFLMQPNKEIPFGVITWEARDGDGSIHQKGWREGIPKPMWNSNGIHFLKLAMRHF